MERREASMSEPITTAERLVAYLKQNHQTVATAESLTGGLVSKKITDVSGASAVFECGVCSYSNRIKQEVLGVREETLSVFSEYSHECACEMAQGVRLLSGASVGIATTGIAGPSGGTPERPVGTVYVGISTEHDTKSYLLSLGSDRTRADIRELSAEQALALALAALEREAPSYDKP